jgi:hypothetical protein
VEIGFGLGIGIGWVLGVFCYAVYSMRPDTKEGTPSASHNTGRVSASQICPYWRVTLCHANVWRDHKMCKGCRYYTGKLHHA